MADKPPPPPDSAFGLVISAHDHCKNEKIITLPIDSMAYHKDFETIREHCPPQIAHWHRYILWRTLMSCRKSGWVQARKDVDIPEFPTDPLVMQQLAERWVYRGGLGEIRLSADNLPYSPYFDRFCNDEVVRSLFLSKHALSRYMITGRKMAGSKIFQAHKGNLEPKGLWKISMTIRNVP